MSENLQAIIVVFATFAGVGIGAVGVPLLLDWWRERARHGRRPGRVWTREDDDELARWREGKI